MGKKKEIKPIQGGATILIIVGAIMVLSLVGYFCFLLGAASK